MRDKKKGVKIGMALHIGIAHCGILHTIQVDDVIPILLPAVGWMAAPTLVVTFPKNSWHVVCISCLVELKCG